MDERRSEDELQTREQMLAGLATATGEAADGWIEWGGGECPVPAGTKIDVRDVDGEVWSHVSALDYTNDAVMWRHECPFEICNIGAYRVVSA